MSGEGSAARMSKTKKHKPPKMRRKKAKRKKKRKEGRKNRRPERTASFSGLGQFEWISDCIMECVSIYQRRKKLFKEIRPVGLKHPGFVHQCLIKFI